MARQYKTGLIITGDASGGIKAVRATEKELGQLNKGFDRGSKRAKKFAENSGGVSREMAVLRRAAAPVAATIAGLFAANNLRNQIDFADQLQKTKIRIGASTEALSQYNYVAKLSGVQFNQLTTAWQRQSRRIAQAAQGTGEAEEALKTLGLSAGELAQMAPEDQFEAIAEAMQGVAGESQRVALAQKLWDSEGVNLLQIVNQGTDAISRMRAEAEALGLTISQETADDMASFNDEMDRLKFAAQGATNVLLADLVPALTGGMQTTTEFIQEMGGAEAVLERVGDVAGTLATVYLARRLGPTLLTVGTQGLVAGRNIAAGLAVAAGATGPLNRALVITQGRMAATAAAGRAMTASLALVGGPLGAAVIAAGAIYMFRDELGLTLPQIDANSEAVHQLTGELDDLSRAEAQLTLTRLVGELAEARAAADGVSEALQEASRPDTPSGGGGGILGVSASEITRQTEAIGEISEAGQESRQEIVNLEAAIGMVEGRLGELDETASRTAPTITKVGDASRAAAKEAERQAKAYKQLLDQLFPVETAQRQFREEQELLAAALERNEIGIDRYLEAMDRLRQSKRSDKSAQDTYDFLQPDTGAGDQEDDQSYWDKWVEGAEVNLESFDELAGNTIDNFSTRFGQAFEEMIFDANSLGDAVSGMAESMARSVVSALGEMAAQWLAYQAVQMLVGDTGKQMAGKEMATNAAATSLQAGIAAYASTAAIPIFGPALAPAAMKSALATTAPIATSIAAMGMAHDGIDRVPREGTWLLDKGERVINAPQADRLDRFLNQQGGGRGQAGGDMPVNVDVQVVNNGAPQQATTAVEQRGQRDFIVKVMLDDLQSGRPGSYTEQMTNRYGIKRQGN